MDKRVSPHSKRVDFLFLVALVIVVVPYSILTAHSFFGKPVIVAAILCLGGAAYLGVRASKPWRKIIYGTLIFGGLYGFIFEFVQVYAGAYVMTDTLLPKVFGVLALDNVAGHMLMAFLTFTFYEH